MDEPRYVPVDGEFERRPKKLKPNTDLAKRALRICGRRYYHSGEKSRWIVIEKAMLPLAPGLVSVYPSEWVEQLLSWAEKKNRQIIQIPFPALLAAIENEDRKTDFIAKWTANHQGEIPTEVIERKLDDVEDFNWEL